MAVIYNPQCVQDGLVLYLDAGNQRSYPGSGNVWYDISGTANSGELINSPIFNSGALLFNGSNNYININDNPSLQLNNFTLDAWVYPINNSENGHIIRKEGSYILSHYWASTNKLGVWVQRTGGWESTHANISVPLNTWCNIVGTYDNSVLKVFYNGDKVTYANKTGSIRVTSDNVFINGDVSNSNYQNYSCSIVKIYNRSLSEFEVKRNFDAGRWRFGI